ncbi:MAG TPA: ATP-binding protein [Nitrolancea sp.]|nr:ATP-binding protein [Nitrolancea sp.]
MDDQIRAARDALDQLSRLIESRLVETPEVGDFTAPARTNLFNPRFVIDFVSSLSVARSTGEVADAIIRGGVPAMGATSGVVSTLTDDRQTMQIVAATGLSMQGLSRSRPVPLDAPVPMAAVVGRGEPLWFGRVDDLADEFPSVFAEVVGQSGALAVLPLWGGHLMVGVLSLRFDFPQSFADDQRETMLALAQVSGAALARVAPLDANGASRGHDESFSPPVAFLRDAFDVLAAPLSANARLNRITELSAARLADCCLVICWDADRTLLQLSVAHRDPRLGDEVQRQLRENWPRLATSAAFAPLLTSDQPAIFSEYQPNVGEQSASETEIERLLALLPLRSVVVAPIVAESLHRGAFILMSSASEQHGAGDLQTAAALARVIGMLFQLALFPEANGQRPARSLPYLDEFIMSMPLGLAFHDRDLRYVWVNRAVESLSNASSDDFAGRSLVEIAPQYADMFDSLQRRALTTGEMISGVPVRLPTSNQSTPLSRSTAYFFPVHNRQSETVGVGAAIAPADTSEDRPAAPAQIFNDAVSALAASVVRDDTVAIVGPLIVPVLADFCVIHLVGEGGSLSEALCYDFDPGSLPSVRHLSDLLIRGRHQLFSPAQLLLNEALVIRNGESAVREILPSDEWFEAARESHLVAFAIVPIAAGDRALGTLAVGRRSRDLEFLGEDLNLLLSIASQIGQTLDSAQRLRDARAEAQQREQILSIAAHELRTPLTAIFGYNQLLMQQLGQATPDLSRATENTRQILRQSRRLDELISNLLDVARIQQRHLELQLVPCDLVQIVRDSLQQLDDMPEWTSAHRLRTDLPPTLTGVWDPMRLGQVVTNLVSNAVKYSPSGGRITVGARSFGEIVEVSISDQGIGIAPDDQSKLFQPFSRSESIPNQIQGVGLGLYIVSNIVDHHHGAITVQSELGVGTTFVVLLPRIQPQLNRIRSSEPNHL